MKENKESSKIAPEVGAQNAQAQATAAPNSENQARSDGGLPAAPCSAYPLDGGVDILVYKSKENAEYVRNYLKGQLPDQEWRQLVLHESDPLPKGLSNVRYLPHPDESKVESHRLAF